MGGVVTQNNIPLRRVFYFRNPMAENTRLAALFSKPPLGSGLVQEAAKVLQSRPYQLHVQEAKATGDTPMTPEEWLAAQKAGKN